MRTRARWFLVAAAALVAAWVATPAAVPLYDGIGFPDEPYRYVSPPPGYRTTPPPTSGLGSAPAGSTAAPAATGFGGPSVRAPAGHSVSTQDIYAKSAEQMPQVEVFVAKGSLVGPAAVRGYQVSAIPVAAEPPAAPGESGVRRAELPIDGDVYRVRIGCSSAPPSGPGPMAVAKSCPVSVVPHGSGRFAWIALRATSDRRPAPVFLYRPTPAAAWHKLPTDRAGRDIYATTLHRPGDYALTFGAAATSAAGPRSGSVSSSHGPPTTVVVLATVLAGLTVAVGAIRFGRTRRRDP